MHRYLLRLAALAITAPLLLGGCKDNNADPVKPRVTLPSVAASAT